MESVDQAAYTLWEPEEKEDTNIWPMAIKPLFPKGWVFSLKMQRGHLI